MQQRFSAPRFESTTPVSQAPIPPLPAAATYMGRTADKAHHQPRPFLLKGGVPCEGVQEGKTKVMLSSLLKNMLPKIDTRSQKHYNQWATSKSDCSFFYTKKEGRLAGFVCFHRGDTGLNPSSQVVDLLYVSPAFRQEGLVAQDLLTELVKHQEEVMTVCPDEDAAKVYELAGFRRQQTAASLGDGIFLTYP